MARKVYTTGTLYEKETGRYQSEPWQDRPAARAKKKIGTGTATATKGARDEAASKRGVGQPSVAGFMNRNSKVIARKALAAQRPSDTDLRNKRAGRSIAEYALSSKPKAKKPPRRR